MKDTDPSRTSRLITRAALLLVALLLSACSGSSAGTAGGDSTSGGDSVTSSDVSTSDAPRDDTSSDSGSIDGTGPTGDVDPAAKTLFPTPNEGWPAPNVYSWDGSFRPQPGDFPLSGLLDDEYNDGHLDSHGNATPILPPGKWDWSDPDNDLANWRNFDTNIGHFEMLRDAQGRHYGWRLVGNDKDIDFSGPSAYFEGSSGTDILILGSGGSIHSFTGNMGDGPDVLVFDKSWSLDFRTGSSKTGALHDNDLVIGGCTPTSPGVYEFRTTTIHTGPGSDWIFARDMQGAAIDAGNGEDGRTDAIDPNDGDDVIVLRGNIKDVRVFGGRGNDTIFWYLDELGESIAFLGANFFGAGGAGDAIWNDDGTDRLVLVVPTDTTIVTSSPTPAGALLVRGPGNDSLEWDQPTVDDPFAKYCLTCGVAPDGRRTMIMEYNSKNGTSFTGWFYVTKFEELQIGVGPGAKVYRLDAKAGTATLDPSLVPLTPPPFPDAFCQ